MKRESARPLEAYELGITLLGIDPRIWRRFAVRSDQSLADLHNTIQIVMGWEDDHLHEFEIEGHVYADHCGTAADHLGRPVQDERQTFLRDVVKGEGLRFRYVYDFGDDWQHELEVIRISRPEAEMQYPVCLGGGRACPPEDCGGVSGYERMLESIADPMDPQHEDYCEWLAGGFDPEAFDPANVNSSLRSVP